MIIENKLDEIICILKNNGTSNVIALISTIIALIALIVSVVSNIKTSKRYINSLKPLLSFDFYQINGMLLLSVKNTGMSEATKIKLNIIKIYNNGNNKLALDDLFKNEFMLYPTEEVQGIVGIYENAIDKKIFPVIDIDISYIQGNDNKFTSYFRTISFKKNIYGKNKLSEIEDSLESLSYSVNRMTNYIEGRTLFTFDKINSYPKSSLYQDMKDAINNNERIDENSENKDNGI